MEKLFTPGVLLMNRLKYPQKFAIISILPVLLVMVLLFVIVSRTNSELAFISKEKEGLTYISPLRMLFEDTQTLRGLSNAYLNGNTHLKDQIIVVKAQIKSDLEMIDQVNTKLGVSLGTDKQWSTLKAEWEGILKEDVTSSFFYRSTLQIGEILELIEHIGYTSNLLLDNNSEGYYLVDFSINKLPMLVEALGQARGLGTGFVTRQSITSEEKTQMIALTNNIAFLNAVISEDIQAVFQKSPHLLPVLSPYFENRVSETNHFIQFLSPYNILEANKLHIIPKEIVDMYKETYISKTALGVFPKEYFEIGTTAIVSNFQFYDACIAALDELLQSRINQLSGERQLIVIFAVIALALVAYLLKSFYSSVISKIFILKNATKRMSIGDLTVRVDLETKDELQMVGLYFNKLSESFQQMIADIQQKENQIKEQKQFYENIIQNSLTPMFVIDSNHNIMIWNRSCEKFTGVKAEDVLGTKNHSKAFGSEDHPCLSDLVLYDDFKGFDTNYRVIEKSTLLPDGLYAEGWVSGNRYIAINAAPIYNENGDIIAAIQSMQDIVGNKLTEDNLRIANSVFENTLEGIIVVDSKESNIQWANSAFSSITGYSLEEVLGKHLYNLRKDHHDAEFFKKMWESVYRTGRWQGEIWNTRKNGEAYPEWMTIISIKDDTEEVLYYVFVFSDITTLKDSEKKLEYLAHFDPLTGLPNRMLFNNRLNHAIAHSKRHDEWTTVLFLDLDHFKLINDTYGHSNGDVLLQSVAKRLLACVGKHDTVSRLGGDEFTVILPNLKDKRDAAITAQKMIDMFSQPFRLEEHEFFVTTSIGISMYPADGDDSETLVKNADIAMYHAKNKGRNNFQFYNTDMGVETFGQLQMESLLHKALEQKNFVLHYQPQLDLYTNEIIGMEALVRMKHTDHKLIPPAQFISLAEKLGLIVPIGEWVLRTACEQNKAWQQAGYRPVRIAVNLSVRQFQQDNLVEMVERVLIESGLHASYLELEITESISAFNIEKIMEVLSGLSSLGVRISIDDFGTGHSSLVYLKHFPVDSLKIDRSFIKDISRETDDSTIAATIIKMAKELGLEVVAEGVETEDQLAFLYNHHCDVAQGYFIGKPVPAQEVEKFLTIKSFDAAQQ